MMKFLVAFAGMAFLMMFVGLLAVGFVLMRDAFGIEAAVMSGCFVLCVFVGLMNVSSD